VDNINQQISVLLDVNLCDNTVSNNCTRTADTDVFVNASCWTVPVIPSWTGLHVSG